MHSLRGAICFVFLSIVSTIAATSRCSSEDQLPINCSCFEVKSSTSGLTWDESKQHCSKDSATLASIKSSYENDMLGEHLNSGDSWIGLKAEPNSSFLLPDGKKAPFVIPQVSKTFKTQKCIAVRSSNVWRARSCDEVHSFVCVLKRSNTSCPNNWTQTSDSCFWLVRESKLNFTAAEEQCTVKWKAKLAEFFTEKEYQFVRKELSKGIGSWLDVWLGLRKDTNAKKYTYISNNSVPNYTSVGVKFIQTASTDSQRKYCVTMQLTKYKTKWEAKQCDSKLSSYVCQTEINRDFDITATNVNETSANISWSIHPSQCGIPANSYLKLKEGSKVQQRKNITERIPWVTVNNLKPGTKYEIEITSNNVKKYKETFQTIEIRNPLSLLRDSSSSINAVIGDTVYLLCAAKGEPPIIYSWKKDNKKIRSYVEIGKPYRSSILSIKLINHTSYGQYVCHVQDRFSNKSHTITIQSIPDVSEGNQKIFVVFIVILAIIVVVLLVIIAYFVRYVKQLKQKSTAKTTEVAAVELKNVANEGGLYEKPQDSTHTAKAIDDTLVEDENASYTALKRNRDDEEEEDHYYSPLKDAPLYVNASEFKSRA